MTVAEAILKVTSQRFTRINTGNGTSALIPICSNPQCNQPIRDLSLGIWASIESSTSKQPYIEIRAFCRDKSCDPFRDMDQASGYQLMSCWWGIRQLWQSDQRGPMEGAGA